MRPIGEKNLLADIEGLKKSPWFNADYISDERRLGMKEALDMMGSIIRHSPTIDAVPVEVIKADILKMQSEIERALNDDDDEWAERAITRKMTLEIMLEKWRAERKEE